MVDKFDGFLLKRDGQVTLRAKEGVEAIKEADTITGIDENDQNCIDFANVKDYVFRDADKSRVLDTYIYDMRER